MVDLTADVPLSVVQSSLHNDIQALLKEMNSRCTSQKGWIRWNLEKKVEIDPSSSSSMIHVLVRELEKKPKTIHKTHSQVHVIPLLHTLHYVVIQSVSLIPASLYQRVCECLVKLLIFPLPYSSVALSTLSSVKMEMATPGSLYLRRIIAEQNLKSKHFTLQEKVFVLADPAVFSAQLEERVRAYLEVSGAVRAPSSMETNVLMCVLQKGLGSECEGSRLAQALEALGDQTVERYFEEVVLAVEQGIKRGAGGCAAYVSRLQHIQREILAAAKDEIREEDCSSACRTAMCFPEIKFLLWANEEDLWNLLANFTLKSCSNSSVDEDERDKRACEDSGVSGHLNESGFNGARNSSLTMTRRNAFKKTSANKLSLMQEKFEGFPGSSSVLKEDWRSHTARVVVMGDDRVLGRLTKAYHAIRERESKHLMLTKKLSLQFYYIPVTDVEPRLSSPDGTRLDEGRLSFASLLGRLDPWYNSNINSLRATISNLAGKHGDLNKSPEQSHFLLDTLCYYLRCGTQPVHLPLYSVKMTCSTCDGTSVVEEVFVSHLAADIPEFRHLKERFSKEPSTRRKKSTVVVYGAVITISYTKTCLSKRKVVRGEAPMTCGVVITSEPAADTAGEAYLNVSFDSINGEHNTEIKTQNISIKTMEHRTLSVCLDKDSRRTYSDVQRLEISPCMDPGCSLRCRFSVSNERELPLSKYLNKVLSLPINTFTGVTL